MAPALNNIRLGKQKHIEDERTLRLGDAISDELDPPHSFDFDKERVPFPLDPWGNDLWGDCVFVMEANGLIRLQRVESRRTIPVNTEVVVSKYKALTGAEKPGDVNDSGFVILNALKDWRNSGWKVGKHDYRISAYGELNRLDHRQLRQAIFLLGGVYFGFALPLTARTQLRNRPIVWDAVPTVAPDAQPGSWGGHAVFAKRYDENGVYVLTWGMEVYVTNAFISRYCDEAWSVVDALDRHSSYLDVPAMEKHLHDIGAVNVD